MNKEQFERALTASPVKPVHRTKIGKHEIFVADGFVPPTHFRFLERFAMTATPDEFPFGCYVTIWYEEKKVGLCGIAICDAMHDSGNSLEAKAAMRIQSAVAMAQRDILRKKLH